MQTKEKYLKLKEVLEENKQWPLRYMFKFIIPNHSGKVDLAKSRMPQNSMIKFKHTKNLKYVSLTCVAHMHSASDIIMLTQELEAIEGVMSL